MTHALDRDIHDGISARAAAARAGVNVKTIHRAVRDGDITARKVGGRGDLRINETSLAAWIDCRRDRRRLMDPGVARGVPIIAAPMSRLGWKASRA